MLEKLYSGTPFPFVGHIRRYDPRTGLTTTYRSPSGQANGIAVSPDPSTLYVASLDYGATDWMPPQTPIVYGTMALFAYELATDGSAKNRTPRGADLAFIPTPESPTNVRFGRGSDIRYLYITAGSSLYRIRTERSGFFPDGVN